MLKATSETICAIFNYSLENKIFPLKWTIARVMLSFKKDDKSKPSNYRPISLLSCVGKVMERVVYKYIFNYIVEQIPIWLHKKPLHCLSIA